MTTTNPLPAYREFRRDQRLAFLSALKEATLDPEMRVSVVEQAGEPVAIIHKGPLPEAQPETTKGPVPPINWLANADAAEDVIHASRHVLLFVKNVHQMQQCDGELGREETQEGLAMILSLVDDALRYAGQLAAYAREKHRQVQPPTV